MKNGKFVFGVATAAYQIEGAAFEDGRTASIWDTFSHTPGKTVNNENGDVACDHYHRYKDDVQLISDLGVEYYRFSISWPRIYPHKGQYNPAGMTFYKNLMHEIKAKGMKAAVTLYHWDLPQWCQDLGGWANRESCDWFLEFAAKCFDELREADMWFTFNEPMCICELGYGAGVHAPGIKDTKQFLQAWHHVALSHGMAVKLYRQKGLTAPIGIVINTQQQTPLDPSNPDDLRAADFANDAFNGWYLYPIFRGCYPETGKRLYRHIENAFDYIHDGDFEVIGEPMDFIGINYYQEFYVRYVSEQDGIIHYETVPADGPKTMLNWNITPQGLENVIRQIREYTDIPLLVAENGSAWADTVSADGQVHDTSRVEYLKEHLEVVRRANEKGLNVCGYFAWSLMDNFEWTEGYAPRFGLIYVDYETQKRIPKDSYYTYRDLITRWNAGGGLHEE